MLGTVAFDGASEGPQWSDIAPDIQDFFGDLGFSLGTALELAFTVGIVLGLAVIAAIYFAGHRRGADRRPPAADRRWRASTSTRSSRWPPPT